MDFSAWPRVLHCPAISEHGLKEATVNKTDQIPTDSITTSGAAVDRNTLIVRI
jgi:K+-transporting ATPase c subunit